VRPLIIDESLKKGEVIVVLSAGVYESGLPDFRTLIRLRKALEIYHHNYAGKFICAGGVRINKVKKSIAEAMKETLMLYGVPQEHIAIQDDSINTYNDITSLLREFKKEFDFNKAIFVTSSYHTYRVKRLLMKKGINATIVSAEPYELYPNKWSERFDLFREIVREYLAISCFWARGWI